MITNYEHKKMDKIFKWFEAHKFENNGFEYREMNLIFQFSDWIDSDEGLKFICDEFDYVEDEDLEKAKDIQHKFSVGINRFIKKDSSPNYPFLF